MLEQLNAAVFGYALNVVGLFFLASAIRFKKPRRPIEELLGIERGNQLDAAREHLVNQIQTYIGFVILVIGFVLLMGDALNQRSSASPRDGEPDLMWMVLILLVSTLATTAVLKIVQKGYVKAKFRRLLREVVADAQFNLEKNPQLAVQIGELLSIPKQPDQAVNDYIRQVRTALGVQARPAGGLAAGLGRAR
jgi:hypothetical protein